MITANEARAMVKANDIMPSIGRKIEKAAKSCHTSVDCWVPNNLVNDITSELKENGFSVSVSTNPFADDNESKIIISWEEEVSIDSESDREEDLDQQHLILEGE